MADDSTEFDPESPEEREVAGEAARDSSDFLAIMSHFYRGELGRTASWRTRIDRTTNWAVVLTATLLTWAFSSTDRPHYVLLVGVVMVTVFLVIEARRYRVYDIWRSRVRLLEENVLANALDPEGVEHPNWRELLSDDLREPALKTPAREAVARRLRRIYLPLLSVLLGAWVVRLTVFAESGSAVETAAVGALSGAVVVAAVALFYAAVLLVVLWPSSRRAKGAFGSPSDGEEWK